MRPLLAILAGEFPGLKAAPPAMNSPLKGPRDVVSLRRLADEARERRDWASAALYYGLLLEIKPGNPGLWLQRGHMLKEAGLLASASESYDQARAQAPSDPEIILQFGLLRKQLGQFAEAKASLEQARDLGYRDDAFITRELKFLRETEGRQLRDMLLAAMPKTPFRFYISSVTRFAGQESAAALGDFLGLKDYSYAFSSRGFHEALELLQLPFEIIDRPEFIPDIRQRSPSTINIHLGFYPPNSPRLLKGAYNIAVLAWEFERLHQPHELMRHHAFADPAFMLTLPDEVWCVSEYTAEAVRASAPNVRTVSSVPAPILSGVLGQSRSGPPNLQETFQHLARLDRIVWRPLAVAGNTVSQLQLSQDAKRRSSPLRNVVLDQLQDAIPVFFLTIFNVFDARKQIRPMLEAFIQFSLDNPDAYLLLKVSYPHHKTGDVQQAIYDTQIAEDHEIPPCLVSDRIWVTTDALTRDEMNTLYDLSAFCISTSHGEGQNLTLLEAMGRGAVPVSVDHTAMRDYIGPDNAIVIPSTLKPFTPRLSGRYGLQDIRTYFVETRDVIAAMQDAVALTRDGYAQRSAAALAVVREKFGITHLRLAIDHALVAAKRMFGSDTH